MPTKRLFTIGHSTRPLEEFITLLVSNKINILVDVRTIPKSRRYPWFNKENLDATLKTHKIRYLHLNELGGLRKTVTNSINTAWHNLSFRGYADYMQTDEFSAGLDKLNQLLLPKNQVCIMCAEAVPWRCHRSLIGDAELIRDIEVIDIINEKIAKPHSLTSFAVIDKTTDPVKIYYPTQQQEFKL